MVLLALVNMLVLLFSFLVGLRRREGAIPERPNNGPTLDQFTGPQKG
jgi:hypothetical protein